MPIDQFLFWKKVNKTESCWLWTASKNTKGYGQFKVDSRLEMAHKISFALTGKQLLKRDLVCHTCDNPSCVNPDHLYAGNHSMNTYDCWQRGRRNKSDQLTQEDVNNIRKALAYTTRKELATRYGVSKNTIEKIANYRTWV